MNEQLATQSSPKPGAKHAILFEGDWPEVIPYGHAIEPRPETQQFVAEISDPSFVSEGGITFGIFRLNRNYETPVLPPVVINLGLGGMAQSSARAGLNAFCQTIRRPLIVIDTAGMGTSRDVSARRLAGVSFGKLAANHLAIINRLGVEKFDIVGNSMGGIMGAKIAELAGERTKHLITFSAPSFEPKSVSKMGRAARQNGVDFASGSSTLGGTLKRENDLTRQATKEAIRNLEPKAKAKTALAGLKYAVLMRKAHMSELAEKLSPATKWLDVTGTADAYSDWQEHLAEVRSRNTKHPGSSRMLALQEETHAWQAHYRWEVAAIAAAGLEQ